MKKWPLMVLLLAGCLVLTNCGNSEEKTSTEQSAPAEDEMSDAEYEKEMQKLDEDVEAMDSTGATQQ